MGSRQVELPPAPEGPDRPIVLARVYPGYHEQATELFQADAEELAHHGYLPLTQSYAEGRYSRGTLIITTFLIFFGIGILMLLYMAAVRPPGNLAVTYVRRDALPYLAR